MTKIVRLASRRVLVLAAGTAAAGTLAAATVLRKPPLPPLATLAASETPVPLPRLTGIIPTDPPRPPATAPFTDADGAPRGLGDYAGKIVVVNLWATWCGPCKEEMPALAVLAKRGAAEGIVVLPLSSDHGGAPVVRRYFTAHGIDGLPVLLDAKGEVAQAWGARGLPTTLIIDRQGRERARVEGAADWASEDALALIRQLAA